MGDERRYGDEFGKALEAVARWHSPQVRKGSTIPYISHLLTVSALVWEDGGDQTEAIAALLHDTVEDVDELTKPPPTHDDLVTMFGSDVMAIVDDCSDATPALGVAKDPWFDRKTHHIDKLWEVTHTTRATSTARVVGADKLANIRTMLIEAARRAADEADDGDFWATFKGGLGGTTWYFEHMYEIVLSQIPASMLTLELGKAVDQLVGLCTSERSRFAALEESIGHVLTQGDILSLDPTGKWSKNGASTWLAFELARITTDGGDIGTVLGRWFGPDESNTRTPLIAAISRCN